MNLAQFIMPKCHEDPFLKFITFHPAFCGYDALNLVRCFGTLNFGNFYQSFQFNQFLPDIKFLLSFKFMDFCHIGQNFVIPSLICKFAIIKCSHKESPNKLIFLPIIPLFWEKIK